MKRTFAAAPALYLAWSHACHILRPVLGASEPVAA